MTALADYEGHDVAQSTIRVTRAGDGLSEALSIAPVEFHLDDEVYIVLRTRCVRISHEPIPKSEDGELRRVHTLAAIFGTVVDRSLVQDALTRQREAIEAAAGIQHLEFNNGDQDGDD